MEREAGLRRRFVLTIANVVAAVGLLGLMSYAFLGMDRDAPRIATASGPTLKIRVAEAAPQLTLEEVVQVAPLVEQPRQILRTAIDDTSLRLAERAPDPVAPATPRNTPETTGAVTPGAVMASFEMRRVVIGPNGDRQPRPAPALVRQASLSPGLAFPRRDAPAETEDLSAPDSVLQENGLTRHRSAALSREKLPSHDIVPILPRGPGVGEIRLKFTPPDFIIRDVGPEDRADLLAAEKVAKLAEKEKDVVKDRRVKRERYCMAAAIYYEARGESHSGQRAVAQVVMNRVKSKRYPNTVCGVVFQGKDRRNRCQFSFACDGRPERPRPGRSWTNALEIARAFEEGDRYAAYSRATHYHADYVRPRWSRSMDRIGKIGRHIFLNGV